MEEVHAKLEDAPEGIGISDEIQVVLLLDIAVENPLNEAMLLKQIPATGAPPRVLRLTDFGAQQYSTGTPDNWRPLMSAIDRMLHSARKSEQAGRCRYWIAGRAGLPAFFYLGYRLSKKAVATLINPRDATHLDVIPLDAASAQDEVPQPYFVRSPWPSKVTVAQIPVALVVSSRIRVSSDQIIDLMSHRSSPTTTIVEAQTSGALDAASVGSALSELDEQITGIQTWYPRCSSLSVFIAGPVTLAFLAGRAINPHIFPDVQVFQHRNHQYELAYETRSQRKKHPILFLISNPPKPQDSPAQPKMTLPFDEEAHDIEQELLRSTHRDQFEVHLQLAPRAMELRRQLQTLKPSVVHFSGHGNRSGLQFHDQTGAPQLVSPEALRELFGLADASVKIALLNACYSESQAQALLEHVDCVVGVPAQIKDGIARRFAVEFYGALADGASVQDAYDAGLTAIRISYPNTSEHLSPRLMVRPKIDARTLILATASQ